MEHLAGIAIGDEGEASTTVTEALTVRHFQPTMPDVYGTPFMILLMEVASANAINPRLPEGWMSVGVDVNIRHLAATPRGRTVRAKARVIEVTDKLVRFEVEAWEGEKLIGKGTHSRAPIELARFERGLASAG